MMAEKNKAFSRIERELVLKFIKEKTPEILLSVNEKTFSLKKYLIIDESCIIKKSCLTEEEKTILASNCEQKIKCSFYFNGRGVWFHSYLNEGYDRMPNSFVFKIPPDIFKIQKIETDCVGKLILNGERFDFIFKDTLIADKSFFLDREGQEKLTREISNWFLLKASAEKEISVTQKNILGTAFFFSANSIAIGFSEDVLFCGDMPKRGSFGEIFFTLNNRLCQFSCVEKGSAKSNGFFVLILELQPKFPEDYRFVFEYLYSENCSDFMIDDVIKKMSQ